MVEHGRGGGGWWLALPYDDGSTDWIQPILEWFDGVLDVAADFAGNQRHTG